MLRTSFDLPGWTFGASGRLRRPAPQTPLANVSRRPRKSSLWWGGLLGAALWALSPAPARAAEPGPDTLPIHVIAIQTPDADDQAEALTKAMRMAVRAMPGWSLGEGDNSLEVLIINLKCKEPPDAECQSRIADLIKSDRYIWGIVEKKGDNVTGDLHIWIRGQGANKVRVDYSANLTEPNDDALKKVANDALTTLTGGPPKGQLHVKAGNVNGQVFVDGQPVGALANGDGTFSVPSGTHKVTVKADGYNDAETMTVVKPTSPVDVALTPQVKADPTPVNYRKVGGFAAVGAGAVLVGLGVVSTLQVADARSKVTPDDLKVVPKNESACAWAAKQTGDTNGTVVENINKQCAAGKQWEPLQFVFYGVGAAVAGAGAFLVYTGSTSSPSTAPKTGWTFTPEVGLKGGGVTATYTW